MRALPFPLKSSSTLLSKNSKRKKINLSALFPGMMGKKKIQLADGTELDLSKMHYSDLEAMIKDIGEVTGDVDGDAQVRIRCE